MKRLVYGWLLAALWLGTAGCRAQVTLQFPLDTLTLPLTGVTAPGGSVVFYLEHRVDLRQAEGLRLSRITWDYQARSEGATLAFSILISDTGNAEDQIYARCTGAAVGACEALQALGYQEAPAYLDQAALFLQDQVSGWIERSGIPAPPQAAEVLQRCVEKGEMWLILKVELPLPQFASFQGHVVLENPVLHLEGTADFGGLSAALWPLL